MEDLGMPQPRYAHVAWTKEQKQVCRQAVDEALQALNWGIAQKDHTKLRRVLNMVFAAGTNLRAASIKAEEEGESGMSGEDWPRTLAFLDANQLAIARVQRRFTPAARDLLRVGFDGLRQAASWFQLQTGPRFDVYVDGEAYHEFFQADDWVELESSLRGSLVDAGAVASDVDGLLPGVLAQIDPQKGGTAHVAGVTVKVEGPYPGDRLPAALTGQRS
jgi:hypothetical protein